MRLITFCISFWAISVLAQISTSNTILNNIDTLHPDLSKAGSCASPNGPMKTLTGTTFNWQYLYDNGYCYTGNVTTSSTTMCFTFVATTSSASLNAGFSESCNNNTFGPFSLYKSSNCSFVTSSLTPSNLIVGASYTWCVTMRAYGGGFCTGYNTFCPYVTFNTVLPVEFIDFKGNCNTLYWNTASELNSSYFIIETSVDGISWDVYTTEMAMGFSTVENNYSVDITPYLPITYYRLTEVDLDGKSIVLKTISVLCDNYVEIEDITVPNGQSIGKVLPKTSGIYFIKYITGEIKKLIQ